MRRFFLDDLRDPPDNGWIIARTSDEAKQYVLSNGMPSFASFDHDLGGDDTAMIFIKWLVNYDMDSDYSIIPCDFEYIVHSANPVGKKNIEGYLENYLDVRKRK